LFSTVLELGVRVATLSAQTSEQKVTATPDFASREKKEIGKMKLSRGKEQQKLDIRNKERVDVNETRREHIHK